MTTVATVGHSAEVDRSEPALRVDVLGPLGLTVQGRPVEVPGSKRRVVLALLALEAGRGVGTERLVDALWPDGPPENAVQALYSHVSRLRGHLGPAAHRLQRLANGYLLDLGPGELDVEEARRLAAVDPVAALALWRGEALAEFSSVPGLDIEALALAQLRLQLVDGALEARLADGDRSVTVDASAATAANPLNERTVSAYVRALAAEARTDEALRVARRFRRRLADETGLDPSPSFSELERLVASGGGRPVAQRVARPDGPMTGRGHDREEVVRLLGTNKTVTVTGPGGVGKTRLVYDIAADLPGDCVVVALAAVERPDRVCQAVASALGLRTGDALTPAEIARAVADRSLTLVLDNCEHVVAACRELVGAVRRTAPEVRILATSRVTLQVPGEYVVRLQPLPLPRDATDLAALRRQPAVRAFVEHARRRRPGYDVGDDEAADLVEVLRRLDGLPLGIELAARQVAVMPLRQVRERLDRALDLATGREVAEDHRQRTLRATIASSYRLLDEPEQALLRAIAPFPGGVDLSTVELLAPGTTDPVELLHRLVDASLVVADTTAARYHLLFTVRAFLMDELTARGELDQAHERFVARCREVAEEIRAHMFGPGEQVVDRRLRAELDNLRAARDLAAADDRVAITLAANEVTVWRDLREIWSWAFELAEDPTLARHPRRAVMLALAAEAARLVGDFQRAGRLVEEAISLGPDDPEVQARVANVRGSIAHFDGCFSQAREEWSASAGWLEREAGSLWGSAALAAAYGGDLVRARELLDRTHAVNAVEASGSSVAFASYVEGELRLAGDPEEAVPFYLAAIEEARRVGCTFVAGVAQVSLASARTRSGDRAGAAAVFDDLLALWRRTGHATQLWTTARNAAELLAQVGHAETAALLLICADDAPGAAVVDPRIARFSSRVYLSVDDLVTSARVESLRAEAADLGPARILDRAQELLAGLRRPPAAHAGVMGPTDWTSGERVFGPPSGTVDPDWLVPALLELAPGATRGEAGEALAEAWRRLRADMPARAGSQLEEAAARIVADAARAYGG